MQSMYLSNAIIDVHGSAPHTEGLGSLALLGHSLWGELRVVDVFVQTLDDSVWDVVLVKLQQALHEV